jgi:predicted signal transduction protein with EAL and GGDEF domain
LTAAFQIAQEMIHISASIGIATSTQAATPEDLIKRADLATYAANSAGRNRLYLFSPDQENAFGKAS